MEELLKERLAFVRPEEDGCDNDEIMTDASPKASYAIIIRTTAKARNT